MADILQVLLGLFLAAIGLYALACVFFPRWRGTWKGTNVVTGATTNLGFALVFLPMGLLMILTDFRQPGPLVAIGLPILPGAILVIAGNFRDFAKGRRKPKRFF